MSTRSEAEGPTTSQGAGRSRVARLEADNARLRAALAEREQQIDRLNARAIQESQIRVVADSLPVLISYVDAEGRYRFNNKAYERWFGHARRELYGKHLAEVLGEGAYEALRPMVEKALSGERVSADRILPYRDGGERHVHLEYVPDRREDGAVIGFYALVQDVSESKRAETELRESEARFRAMADSAPAPVWVTNEDGIEFVNRAYVELTGLPLEKLKGDVWTRLIHPDDLPPVLEARAKAWRDREDYSYDGRFRRYDGEWLWMRVSSRPRFADGGVLIGYVGMAVDISDAKRAEAELRESEARFRAMADSAPAPVWVTNADGIEFANRALAEFTGQAVDELLGGVWMSLMHPDDLAAVQSRRAEAWADKAPYEFEARFRRHDGEWRWLRASCKPRESAGAFLGYVGMAVDVTESRRTEDALRESEARFREVANAAPVLIWLADTENRGIWYNQLWLDFTGRTMEQECGHGWLDGVHPDDRARAAEICGGAFARREPFRLDFRLRRADGEWRVVDDSAVPRFAEDGTFLGYIGSCVDVTDARRAEEELRAESRMLGTINRVGAALSAELDLQRLVQMVTDAGVELSGAQFGAFFYNRVDERGDAYMLYTVSGVDRSAFDKFPMPRKTAVFAPTFDGEGVVRSDDITKDPRYGRSDTHHGMPKEHLTVRSYLAVPVMSRSGEVIGGLFFGHPEPARFTERHEQLLVGIAGQAAVAIDNARLFEAAQRELAERARAEEALRDLNQSLETRIAAAIAERERAEEALRQAQKMEAVGQLTGGIAHDFNNLLTVIGGNLDLAARRLGAEADPRVRRAIDNAITGADRAATLTQRLLAFSRRQPLAPKAIDPNALLAGMTELLHRTLGETIEVETRLAAGLWRIEVDPHQLESAILNLAVNARDAMPDGGRLVIETSAIRLDGGELGDDGDIAPGPYVAIAVTDTGTGMDEDTRRRAVEPFFTTKDVGKGTGLGLSMVYGFVKQSGGHFLIDSEEGRGTCVRIYLPRLAGESAGEEQAAAAAAPRGAAGETILVCEDDDDVRAYTVELLGELGYRVLEAHDGPSTLRLVEDPQVRIDLLFTDVVLPGGTSGAGLALRAQQARPGLKVLFTTGYARDAIVHDGRLDPGIELVTKPFAFAELAERIRDVLDRA